MQVQCARCLRGRRRPRRRLPFAKKMAKPPLAFKRAVSDRSKASFGRSVSELSRSKADKAADIIPCALRTCHATGAEQAVEAGEAALPLS